MFYVRDYRGDEVVPYFFSTLEMAVLFHSRTVNAVIETDGFDGFLDTLQGRRVTDGHGALEVFNVLPVYE